MAHVAKCSWRRPTHRDLGVWHHYKGADQDDDDDSEYATYFRKGSGLEATTYVWMAKPEPTQQWPVKLTVYDLTTFESNVGFTLQCRSPLRELVQN